MSERPGGEPAPSLFRARDATPRCTPGSANHGPYTVLSWTALSYPWRIHRRGKKGGRVRPQWSHGVARVKRGSRPTHQGGVEPWVGEASRAPYDIQHQTGPSYASGGHGVLREISPSHGAPRPFIPLWAGARAGVVLRISPTRVNTPRYTVPHAHARSLYVIDTRGRRSH